MAEVNALPDAWPAMRIFTISESLLNTRNSFNRDRRGLTFLFAETLLSMSSPLALGRSLENNEREKSIVLTSAYISVASEIMEGSLLAIRSMSPL